MARNWSSKQTNIFSWFAAIVATTIEHLVVRARAGTGKTTTIVEALNYLPKGITALVCAFNKDISVELVKRIAEAKGITVPSTGNAQKDNSALAKAVRMATGITVQTLHAAGLACVSNFWPNLRIDFSDAREKSLVKQVCAATVPEAIQKLVGKLLTKGREIKPHAKTSCDLWDLAVKFECEPDETWNEQGYDLDFVCRKAVEAMEIAATVKPVTTGIDGADMIFLPVRNGWLRKMYGVVIVDEAQDMTEAQLEIAEGLCKGRIIVVGDDKQAIYAFRGADADSLDRLKTKLNATELPLNTTYRCAKAIVRLAQEYVPDFEAGPDNPEGEVISIPSDKLTATAALGDFILSRANAPLVSVAMSLLKSGKRARIKGRDIGRTLITLVRKFKARSIPELLKKLSTWEAKEIKRLEARFEGKLDSPTFQTRCDAVHDQAEMLAELANGADSVSALEDRIEALFTDDGLGDKGVITCSSVHRSKGLEADRVFVLRETLRTHTQEELNITYVAITRAKNTLVWVGA